MNSKPSNRFILKAVKLKSVVNDLSSEKPNISIDYCGSSPASEENKELRSKNLALTLSLKNLSDKMLTAKFPQEDLLLRGIIIDSSAVTRAKLKKCFSYGNYEIHLPRNRSEAKEMLTNNEYNIVLIEHGVKDSYGLDLLNSLEKYSLENKPKVLVTTFNEKIEVESKFYPLIDGFIYKPWDDLLLESRLMKLTKAFLN